MRIIDKPWGKEIWIAHNESYACKILYLKKGTRNSLQYHCKRTETIYVDEGRALFISQKPNGQQKSCILKPGDVVENRPYEIHQFQALENLRLIEVSTPELDDEVRLEDDYQRT